MARKRLTNKQRATIRKQHQSNLDLKPDQLSAPTLGRISCRHSNQVTVLDDNGTEHLCHIRSNIDDIVVGDQVVWRQSLNNDSGLIERRQERQTAIQRPDHRGKQRTIAANISQVIIVVASQPEPQPHLIDRYLIAIENMGFKSALVLNKIDLAETVEVARQHLLPYGALDYPIIETSTLGQTSNALQTILDGENSIFVGQSGTGKSSLINHLIPDAQAKTGHISDINQQGRHTTSQAQLYMLGRKRFVIDSPGIRQFGLDGFSRQQLMQGFIEFSRIGKPCQFRDCSHLHEPNCQVLAAVAQGIISEQRWKSYRYLYSSIS